MKLFVSHLELVVANIENKGGAGKTGMMARVRLGSHIKIMEVS